MYISKDLRKIRVREELTLIFKLAYIRNKVTRTSNARCLDPKGEVSIMKPARVLWARKYLMTILSGTKLVVLVRPKGSDHGRSLTNSLEVLSAL